MSTSSVAAPPSKRPGAVVAVFLGGIGVLGSLGGLGYLAFMLDAFFEWSDDCETDCWGGAFILAIWLAAAVVALATLAGSLVALFWGRRHLDDPPSGVPRTYSIPTEWPAGPVETDGTASPGPWRDPGESV